MRVTQFRLCLLETQVVGEAQTGDNKTEQLLKRYLENKRPCVFLKAKVFNISKQVSNLVKFYPVVVS